MCGVIWWEKQDTMLWIAFQNIGSFLKEEDMEIKFELLQHFITNRYIDVLGFMEANTWWDVVPKAQWPAMCTWGWWETSQWVVMHNQTEENLPQHQPGGSRLLCVNQVAHCALCPGDDTLGLGHWCWTQLRSPNGFYIQIILMYHPCFSKGPLSMYQQQVQKLSKMCRYECPCKVLLKDITMEMHTRQDDGDHLFVLTDFNDNITALVAQEWAANLGLVEAITHLNPAQAPPTYQWGSQPIDGIFIALQLLASASGGYLSFSNAIPSNHHAIWLDLHLPKICLPHPESHIKPKARQLQCKDPRVVARYNKILLNIMKSQNIPQCLL